MHVARGTWHVARVTCYSSPAVTEPLTTEPETDVRTIADLPFHVMGRFPKPLFVGRCRGSQIEGMSNKELFEQVRDLSLGLSALGVRAGVKSRHLAVFAVAEDIAPNYLQRIVSLRVLHQNPFVRKSALHFGHCHRFFAHFHNTVSLECGNATCKAQARGARRKALGAWR